MFRFLPFFSPNLCAIAISIGAHVCSDERCGKVHGWSFTVQCLWWGIELEYLRS